MTLPGILDAHHHLWDPGAVEYTLFRDYPRLKRLAMPLTSEGYDRVAAAHGITAAICIEVASAGAADGKAETEWLLGQVDRSSVTDALVAWAPLERPDLGAWLDDLLTREASVVGVRRSFESVPLGFATTDEVIGGVKAVAARGLVFDLVLFGSRLREVAELVRRVPEAMFVLDHLGKPAADRRAMAAWRIDIADIATCDNVVAKVSGLFTEAADGRTAERYARLLMEHAIEVFGCQRLMFGTDWPVCELADGGVGRWIESVSAITEGVAAAERQALFRGTAERTYHRRLAASPPPER